MAAAINADDRERIKSQSEDYTKRKSINFIGVRKQRTGDANPRVYDVENLTMNYSYNEIKHRDFEIENSLDQNVRVGANYSYSFEPLKIEPFKKNDSIFTNKYWKLIKDFKAKYPGCEKSESKYSNSYDKLVIEAFGGKGDNDLEKEDKIIKNIAKEVTIDKEAN